jgi:indoleacetamide hydrolase
MSAGKPGNDTLVGEPSCLSWPETDTSAQCYVRGTSGTLWQVRSQDSVTLLMRNVFIAQRVGAAGLTLPVGLTRGCPVGLELDALPGHDSELLGLCIAVEKVIKRIPPPTFQ